MNKIRCMGETVEANKLYDGRKVLAFIQTSFRNGMKAGYREGYNDATKKLERYGHWEYEGYDEIINKHKYTCSLCGYTSDWEYFYCPKCGARMIGELKDKYKTAPKDEVLERLERGEGLPYYFHNEDR